jgi:hypothetical protein
MKKDTVVHCSLRQFDDLMCSVEKNIKKPSYEGKKNKNGIHIRGGR